MKLSSRLLGLKPSATLAVEARARELRAQGVDVVGFGAGEPDFDTPAHIKDAVKVALDRGQTKYTPVAGTRELREAAAQWLGAAHGFPIDWRDVIVSCGAKHSLANLFLALLNPGDEVLIPAPYWVTYPDLVTMAGGKPVIVPTRAQDTFRVQIDALAKSCSPCTRALVLCSPSNPTGVVYSQAEIDMIVDFCVERDLRIVTDDIYRSLVYGVIPGHAAHTGDAAARQRVLIVDSVSKSYAMTGFRIGFCAGPRELIEAMATIQSQSTSNPTSVAQAGALAAISGPQDSVETMRRAFDERRQRMVRELKAIPRVQLIEPRGAFYTFPDVSAICGNDDVGLAQRLLDEHHVAVVPGTAFGAPGYLRLSYATSMERIEEGMQRLRKGLTA